MTKPADFAAYVKALIGRYGAQLAARYGRRLSPQALRGVIVRSYGTVSEEDNDGGGPMYLMREIFPTATPDRIPDVVIITEGTGCAQLGPLGIYRGNPASLLGQRRFEERGG